MAQPLSSQTLRRPGPSADTEQIYRGGGICHSYGSFVSFCRTVLPAVHMMHPQPDYPQPVVQMRAEVSSKSTASPDSLSWSFLIVVLVILIVIVTRRLVFCSRPVWVACCFAELNFRADLGCFRLCFMEWPSENVRDEIPLRRQVRRTGLLPSSMSASIRSLQTTQASVIVDFLRFGCLERDT
jgi:hypothetical protein